MHDTLSCMTPFANACVKLKISMQLNLLSRRSTLVRGCLEAPIGLSKKALSKRRCLRKVPCVRAQQPGGKKLETR